jgi:hypothetical protein
MSDVQGPEKGNDTCGKTMHAGTIDRSFTVYEHGQPLLNNTDRGNP